MDLTAEVAGLRSSGLVHAQLETLACALRLFECIPPIPVKVHQLSAMHEAAAGERDEVGLLPAPACQDGRPLLRATQLVDLLARQDHAAVDDSRHDRRELSRRRRHHRLVEQREPLSDATALEEDAALHMHRKGKEIRVAETLAEFRCCACSRGRALEVAGDLVLEGDGHQHVALLRAFTVLAFDQPLCASEPTGGRAHLPTKRKLHSDPERTSRGAQRDPVVRVALKCAAQDPDAVVFATEHVGRRREQLQILCAERYGPIGFGQRCVSVLPRRARIRGVAPFQVSSGVHPFDRTLRRASGR